MKMKTILTAVLFFCLLSWQCSKNAENGTNLSLKESLNTGVEKLNSAITEVSATRGYQLLNLQNSGSVEILTSKSAVYEDSITLAKIAGIYEYQPISYTDWCYSCYNKLFVKTDPSNKFIVKLPSEKVFSSHRFHMVTPIDSTLENNFVITASDYHYYFSEGFLYDYLLNADVSISDTGIGNIQIQSLRNSKSDYNYLSEYAFSNSYKISVDITSGDTTQSSIAFSDGSSVLLKETNIRIKTSGTHFREKQYILDVGNVEIRRTSASDSIEIYVNGLLQTNAKAEIIDNNETDDHSMCRGHNRDIQITFDDGTTTTLSAMLEPSLTILQNMVTSLESVYFTSNIVDYIALNIYRNQ
jgi:hypothetical protein